MASLTGPLRLSARLTVAIEHPAREAISSIVDIFSSLTSKDRRSPRCSTRDRSMIPCRRPVRQASATRRPITSVPISPDGCRSQFQSACANVLHVASAISLYVAHRDWSVTSPNGSSRSRKAVEGSWSLRGKPRPAAFCLERPLPANIGNLNVVHTGPKKLDPTGRPGRRSHATRPKRTLNCDRCRAATLQPCRLTIWTRSASSSPQPLKISMGRPCQPHDNPKGHVCRRLF